MSDQLTKWIVKAIEAERANRLATARDNPSNSIRVLDSKKN